MQTMQTHTSSDHRENSTYILDLTIHRIAHHQGSPRRDGPLYRPQDLTARDFSIVLASYVATASALNARTDRNFIFDRDFYNLPHRSQY